MKENLLREDPGGAWEDEGNGRKEGRGRNKRARILHSSQV